MFSAVGGRGESSLNPKPERSYLYKRRPEERRRAIAAQEEEGEARPWTMITTGSPGFLDGPAAARCRRCVPIETREVVSVMALV